MARQPRELLKQNAAGDGTRHTTLSIIRLPSVKARTGMSRSTIYLRISEVAFPKPIALGPRAVGWIESEIHEWIVCRIKASRKDFAARTNIKEPTIESGTLPNETSARTTNRE
jgi:prophage regulatory protein